jgi:N6-L-threonylcarbamoyladenine synthase
MSGKGILILGIETSCDETAAALVSRDGSILANVVSSQAELHARYGGVVPEVASRRHLELVSPVVREALARADASLDDVDLVAVTQGPGLIGALLVGLAAAKAIAWSRRLPLAPVDHLDGHIASLYLQPDPVEPPFLCLLASGGHTMLVDVRSYTQQQLLGTTRDDAAGEAFDKVGKLLGLGYPGGVKIDKLAATGDPTTVDLPRALPGRDDLDFSVSGLKTAVATRLARTGVPEGQPLADFCASFQAAVVDVLVRKSRRALVREGLDTLIVCGGVAANRGLRNALAEAAKADGFALFIPPPKRCTDNAAMIAAEGAALFARGQRAGLDLAVDPGLPLEPGAPLVRA